MTRGLVSTAWQYQGITPHIYADFMFDHHLSSQETHILWNGKNKSMIFGPQPTLHVAFPAFLNL